MSRDDGTGEKGRRGTLNKAARPYLLGLPEMDLFPTTEARDKAVRELDASMTPRSIMGWVKFIAFVAPLMLVPFFGTSWMIKSFIPAWDMWNGSISLGVATVIYIGLVIVLIRYDVPRTIRRKLLDAGVPVCMKCGYDLRSIRSERCPECGRSVPKRARELMVASDQA